MTSQEAARFIAARRIEFEQFGVTNITAKQRDRIRRLDVISPERRLIALDYAGRGRWGGELPPRASTGRMRVIDLNVGEVRIQRAPRRSVEIAWAA